MNILVLSWRDPKHPLAGGAEQVMHEHMKGWVKAGHKITLFSSLMKGLVKEESLDGVTIIRGGYQYWGVQFAAFLHYIKNRKNYDLIVDQFHGIPFFTPLYSRKPIVAVIQEPAGKVWFLNPLPWPMNWIVGMIGFLGEPLIFLLFYRLTPFMTGSQSAKLDVSSMGIPKDNITIVPHGVILEKPIRKYKKEKVWTVVYLGILSKDKGIEDALKCFALLNKREKFQFWVIGKEETPEYSKKIQQLTKQLNLQHLVKFWGFVPQHKKFELLERSHILINPSVHEGWGLVNIEANSVGTPIVAYRSAGLIDSVKDNTSGLLCETNSPENLASEVLDLLREVDLYEKLKKGSISWSKEFSWERSIKISLKLIETCVKK